MKNFYRIVFIVSFTCFVAIGCFIYNFGVEKIWYTEEAVSQTQNASVGLVQDIFTDSFAGAELNNNKDFLENFCKTSSSVDLVRDDFVYDYKTSAFVYNLCDAFFDVEDDLGWDESYIKDYIKETFKDGMHEDAFCDNFVDGGADVDSPGCNISNNLNNVKIADLAMAIYMQVINEYYNLKTYALFDDDNIETFSTTYFAGHGVAACEGDSFFLNENSEDKDDPVQNHCYHPKTVEIFQNYQEQVEQMVETKVNIFDKDEIMDEDSHIQKIAKSFSMQGKEDLSHFALFRNITLNENLFYSLFLSSYIFFLQDGIASQDVGYNTRTGSRLEQQNRKIQGIIENMQISNQSLEIADRMLVNMYETFPLHIGLTAYYEDLLAFRSNFKKVYTPLHQLYYKLRNVQEES
ncbi:hypothetical protein [Candidatus Absconditicoccus praedator]|uniref:hypothetical protein n=1 Tax=Candidatus Absconditicoccus praedator TaxID=2735562 RepID=UPI001E356B0A|nr:hypothetical protein [Candidatus Absconditicoccus praedator]UFX82843.1 hypothetical protein HLG78_01760 [Candidatus Absconditicoccus praedator]